MVLKFIKIFFSVLAIMLFMFLLDVTFFLSNSSKNTEIISKITAKQDLGVFYLSGSNLIDIDKLANQDTLTGTFIKNINFVDKIYFSNTNSFDVSYSSGIYDINLEKGLFVLDLNDLSSNYKIKSLGFEIEPKSGGMIFIDNTNESKIFVFSINSIYKFTFKSQKGRKLNYYYNYPHNYLLFDIKNNTFSRIGGDVFRIKTIVRDGFLKKKLKDNLNLGGVLDNSELIFFQNVYNSIKKENKVYKDIFKKIEKLDNFNLIGEKYIEKYSKYFVNDAKKRVYYKQSLLNKIQKLFLEKQNSTDTSIEIIHKLEFLKKYNIKDYESISLVIDGYYRLLIKNNSLDNKEKLDNFLPLINYLKLVKNKKIIKIEDLSNLIIKNQVDIFNLEKKGDKSNLIRQNLKYFYLLRNINKGEFNKLTLTLELKYKQFKKIKSSSKNNLIIIEKYYFGVLNLRQGNDDLELYVLLKNIYYNYDFGNNNLDFEKYFSDFVNIYFSKLKIIDGKIILGQHLDLVLLESFLYYLEDYLNNFAFAEYESEGKSQNLIRSINILEKYMFLNKLIYFENNSKEMLDTGIFKNRDLLSKILIFIRSHLFEKNRDSNNLLLNSKNFDIDSNYIKKFSLLLNKIFILKEDYKIKKVVNIKQRALFKSYDLLEKKFNEYFLALSSYEDYKTKYNIDEQELSDYSIKNQENKLGIVDIKKYFSQFNGVSFDNTVLKETEENGIFLVQNLEIHGGTLSFLLEPERGYTIFDIKIENDIENENKFFYKTYKLEKEKEIWEEKKKNANNKEKGKYNFTDYFKNKFFTKVKGITIIDDDYVEVNQDNENIRVFKRDKLLGQNGEFSNIRDLLKIEYSNIEATSLENIVIKDAEIIKKSKNNNYIFEFNSNYLIDREKNKHYFYKDDGIKLKLFIKNNDNTRKYLIGSNIIKINFFINLGDFKKIFEDIFTKIISIDRIYYSLSGKLGIYDLDIEYRKDGKIVIGFDLKGKNIKLYLYGNKILFTKVNGKILKQKNISLDKGLNDFLLDLKK